MESDGPSCWGRVLSLCATGSGNMELRLKLGLGPVEGVYLSKRLPR